MKSATVGGEAIEYVEVTLDDIALANRLANDVLGRSLDELPPQTRRLLGVIVPWVQARCRAQNVERRELRFGRADVRTIAGLSETQLRLHLERLVDLDYLLVHRGQRGQSFVYELLFDGQADNTTPQLVGLLDVAALREATLSSSRGSESSSRGESVEFAGSSRPQHGVNAVGSRQDKVPRIASAGAGSSSLVAAVEETPLLRTPRPETHRPTGTSSGRKPNGAASAP